MLSKDAAVDGRRHGPRVVSLATFFDSIRYQQTLTVRRLASSKRSLRVMWAPSTSDEVLIRCIRLSAKVHGATTVRAGQHHPGESVCSVTVTFPKEQP